MLYSSYTSIYEKKRVVIIEYAIKISLNKKKKEKVNYQFLPNFPQFLNLFE